MYLIGFIRKINPSTKKSAEYLTNREEEYSIVLPEKGIRRLEGYAEPVKNLVLYKNVSYMRIYCTYNDLNKFFLAACKQQ
jgi:hypothetical protein